MAGGDGEGAGQAGGGLEVDLPGGRIIHAYLVKGEPEHELLGFHPGELLDPTRLDVGRDLGRILDRSPDLLELVVRLLLGLEPHETRVLNISSPLYSSVALLLISSVI
nr:hypothetical protein Iba_chr10fCG5680 [Ipomoea batatas]